jgi:hypothetical protein
MCPKTPTQFIHIFGSTLLNCLSVSTRLQAGRSKVRNPVREKICRFCKTSRPTLGPSSLLFTVYWGSFQIVKRPGREVNHPLPSSAEFKNEWSYTSASPIRFHWVKRENFAFTFVLRALWNEITKDAELFTCRFKKLQLYILDFLNPVMKLYIP